MFYARRTISFGEFCQNRLLHSNVTDRQRLLMSAHQIVDEGSEEKINKSNLSLLARHCYQFMRKNTEHYIPTFSQLKSKNLKINQGQNFKPIERCEFKGLCRPSIQLFKAPFEESISNNKIVKKLEIAATQIPKRNLKTNKASNIVFRPYSSNETSDSVKAYTDLYINKRPGIRTKKIVEEAVQAYNATRDEQEAKRNVLKGRTYFKKESTSDPELPIRSIFTEENLSSYEKQRRTVKVKSNHLPSKDFLDRMRDFNISKRMKAESKNISAEESSNKFMSTNQDNSKKNAYDCSLPTISLPKLKVRQISRREKTLCPMSIINITLPNEDTLKGNINEINMKKNEQRKCNRDLYINNIKEEKKDYKENATRYYDISGYIRTNNKEALSDSSIPFSMRKKETIEIANNYTTTKLNIRNLRENFVQTETEEWPRECKALGNKCEYDGRDSLNIHIYHQEEEKGRRQRYKATDKINFIMDSSNEEEVKSLDQTLKSVNDLMQSNRVILDSLRISQNMRKQELDTGLKHIKGKFPEICDSILPNKLKLPVGFSENINETSINKSKKQIGNCTCGFTNETSRPSTGGSDDYYRQFSKNKYPLDSRSRPSSQSSDQHLDFRNKFPDTVISKMKFPTRIRKNFRYQHCWKNYI